MMIHLHYRTTPDGHKITILLEEARLPYKIVPVNVGAGDQFKPEFLLYRPTTESPPSSTMIRLNRNRRRQ
jgi:GST-like protein